VRESVFVGERESTCVGVSVRPFRRRCRAVFFFANNKRNTGLFPARYHSLPRHRWKFSKVSSLFTINGDYRADFCEFLYFRSRGGGAQVL